MFPDIVDNLDSDRAVRDYAEIVGAAPETIREQSEVDEIRKARAEAMAQQEAVEQGMQGAQAAKTLSETDTNTPNALTALLQGTGGGARQTV